MTQRELTAEHSLLATRRSIARRRTLDRSLRERRSALWSPAVCTIVTTVAPNSAARG